MISFFSDIVFAEKNWFWLFLTIPALIFWYIFRLRKREGEINYSSFLLIDKTPVSWRVRLRHIPFGLRLLSVSALILAMARPQSRSSWKDTRAEGIDIMVSLDVSLSMLSKDFKPNRIEVAKEVIQDFIDSRPNDRIGLVVFSGEAFTQCPLTSDHKVLKNMFTSIKAGMLDQGTAIGLGLANAVSRIKSSKSKSKVILLISDGKNNVGEISPMTAGELAKYYNIRVYCIGVGSRGKALTPVVIHAPGVYEYDYVDVDIDENIMTDISKLTGGKYFRATDKESLVKICAEIDAMEKTIFSEKSFSNKAEHFLPFVITAAILLLLEFILRYTFFRSTP